MEAESIQEKSIIGLFSTTVIICIICFSMALMGIPIANIVIGAIYMNQCPIQPILPTWLIVQGSVGALAIIIMDSLLAVSVCIGVNTIVSAIKDRISKTSLCLAPLGFLALAILIIVNIFALVWFILGAYWVFSVLSTIINYGTTNYCAPVLYWYSLGSIGFCFFLLMFSCGASGLFGIF